MLFELHTKNLFLSNMILFDGLNVNMLSVVYPGLSMGIPFLTKNKSKGSWGSGSLCYGGKDHWEKFSYLHSEKFLNMLKCSLG